MNDVAQPHGSHRFFESLLLFIDDGFDDHRTGENEGQVKKEGEI